MVFLVGLHDSDADNTLRWVSGQNVDLNMFNIGFDSIGDHKEDFVRVYLDSTNGGAWGDVGAYSGDLPEYGLIETPFIRRGDSAYVIVQGPTWEEAEANAVKLGGHLVTINDAAENKFIADTFLGEGFQDLWIGLSRTVSSSSWQWIDKSNLSYANWNSEYGTATNEDKRNYSFIRWFSDSNDSRGHLKGQWDNFSSSGEFMSSNRVDGGIAEIKLDPNNTPTGTPTLSGTLKVGSTLTIDKSPIKDKDNYEGWTPTYSYKWEVSSDSGKTWKELTSSDAKDGNSSYKLTSAEVGKSIRGVVSYMDGYGTNETVRTDSSSLNLSDWSLVAHMSNTGGMFDGDGNLKSDYSYGSFVSSPEDATSDFQRSFAANDSTRILFATGDGSLWAITDYSKLRELIDLREGSFDANIDFVLYRDGILQSSKGNVLSRDGGNEDPWISVSGGHYDGIKSDAIIWGEADYWGLGGDYSGAHSNLKNKHGGINVYISTIQNSSPTGTPTLSGTLKVGSTLTIDKSPIKDKDNYEGWTPTYSYKWEVSSDSGKTWKELTSSDAKDGNSSYKLTSAEEGKSIRGVVTYMDGYGTNETVRTTASSAIQSVSTPTYSISTSESSVNEGDSFTTTVTTKNVADGTTLYWKLSGTGVNSKDFSSGSLEGSGTVKNGKLTFSHTVASDSLTEGDEKVTITLYDASKKSVGTSSVTIKDTSKTPVKPGVKTDISDLTKTISLNESGSTYSWNAQLTTKPTDDVVVTYKSSDATEGLFSNGKDTISLTFTSANWNQSQKVTIKGVDDDVNDGDIKFTVSGTAKSRLDQTYWGQNSKEPLVLDSLSFTTVDDDKPDVVKGTDENDKLTGGSGASDVYGKDGNDLIYGGKGKDRLWGGYGDDIAYGQEGDDKVYGEQGDDFLYGDAGNDYLLGGDGQDELYGGSGDDVLDGDKEGDKMYGGEGSDTYFVDNKDDYVSDSGKTGTDTIYVMSYLGNNYKLGDGLDDLVIDSKAGNISVTGNASDNDITGNDSSNSIDGGIGNDDLDGGGGTDSLVGGEGSDDLNGGLGNDSLSGGSGSDDLIGGFGNDNLDGGTGVDTVDYTDAAAGFVTVDLGKDGNGNAKGDGNDTLKSIENVIGSSGDDSITGSTADNTLTGGDGDDMITGGGGRDIYRYTSLTDSDLASYDWIKDLVIGTDSVDGLYAVAKGSIVGTKSGSSLKVTAFTETSIQKTLTASVFSAKGAAVLTYTASSKVTQTFLALNDTRAGFQSASDALINITGYIGSLANLAII